MEEQIGQKERERADSVMSYCDIPSSTNGEMGWLCLWRGVARGYSLRPAGIFAELLIAAFKGIVRKADG